MSRIRDLCKTEQALRRGYDTWHSGNLEAAIEGLHEVLSRFPATWEAILPLARALGENGDNTEALRVLEDAETRLGANEAAEVFRLLILYDAGEVDALREKLERVDRDNVLARAVEALLTPEDAQATLAALPGAIWLPDIAGRLLALMEDALYAQDPEAADAFHHRLFAPQPHDSPAAKKSAPETIDDPKVWWQELERFFIAKDFTEACRLMKHPQASEWTDPESGAYLAFSLIACGREKEAVTLAARLRLEHPRAADLHFIEGVAWSRLRKPLAAGLRYVRAARFADTDLHYVMRGVAEELAQPVG